MVKTQHELCAQASSDYTQLRKQQEKLSQMQSEQGTTGKKQLVRYSSQRPTYEGDLRHLYFPNLDPEGKLSSEKAEIERQLWLRKNDGMYDANIAVQDKSHAVALKVEEALQNVYTGLNPKFAIGRQALDRKRMQQAKTA